MKVLISVCIILKQIFCWEMLLISVESPKLRNLGSGLCVIPRMTMIQSFNPEREWLLAGWTHLLLIRHLQTYLEQVLKKQMCSGMNYDDEEKNILIIHKTKQFHQDLLLPSSDWSGTAGCMSGSRIPEIIWGEHILSAGNRMLLRQIRRHDLTLHKVPHSKQCF